jgi:hypothetical protein
MTFKTFTNNATPNLSPQSQLRKKIAQLITLPGYTDRAVPGKTGNFRYPILVRDLSIQYNGFAGYTPPTTSKIGMWSSSGASPFYSGNITLTTTADGSIPPFRTGTVTRPSFANTQYWIGFTVPTSAYLTWGVQNNIESPFVARVKADDTSNTGDFNNDSFAISSTSSSNGQLSYSLTYDIIPTAPRTLTATPSGTTVTLSWTAPSSNGGTAITGYRIERRLAGGSFSSIRSNTGSTSTTFADTGLTAGATYEYRIAALNAVTTAAGSSYFSPYSNTASAELTGIAGNATSRLDVTVLNAGADIVVFGDTPNDIHFDAVEVTYGSENLYNRVSVTRAGGEVQTVDAAQSQLTFGIRSLSVTTLNSTDTEALALATELLSLYRSPELRIESIDVNLLSLTGDQLARVLAIDLDTVAQVYFTPNQIGDTIEKFGRIIGISHNIDLETHTVTFKFNTLGTDLFVLDSDISGILDENVLN